MSQRCLSVAVRVFIYVGKDGRYRSTHWVVPRMELKKPDSVCNFIGNWKWLSVLSGRAETRSARPGRAIGRSMVKLQVKHEAQGCQLGLRLTELGIW